MTTFPKYQRELEHHCLELTLAHIRISAPLQLNKLISSIDSCGQLTPVIVVPASVPNQFTLVDGYLRIQALQKLRQDTVKAEVWECSEADALLSLLASHGNRNWEAFEEAQALRVLQTRYQLSLEQIAQQIGHTKSWISRRLALLEALPDTYIQEVRQGNITVWTANRILVPLARANPHHADHLFEYLRDHTHSTREIAEFFKHYQKTNHLSREKMVMQPDLFFKARKSLQAERQAKLLKAGPEGRWRLILATISDQIKHLEKLVPQLFYDRQEEKIREQLLEPLDRIQNALTRISTTSRGQPYDRQNETSDHHHAPSVGQELPAH